jgi:uncharacterized membrane protein
MASLTGLNVAARLVLAGGPPNVKPVAFLCTTAGIVGGPVTGFMVGLMTMLISDIYFGAGYWTIINSACMALVGLLAGLLWYRRERITRTELAVGGFLLTAIYDVATSVIPAWIFGYSWWIAVLLLYVPFLTGFGVLYPFGFVHELTTAVLMVAIGPTLISRVRQLVNHDVKSQTATSTIAELKLRHSAQQHRNVTSRPQGGAHGA